MNEEGRERVLCRALAGDRVEGGGSIVEKFRKTASW